MVCDRTKLITFMESVHNTWYIQALKLKQQNPQRPVLSTPQRLK